MYLILFSSFVKMNYTNNNKSWTGVYRHYINAKLISESELLDQTSYVISSQNNKITHSFPIAIQVFKNIEDIETYKKVIPAIMYKLNKSIITKKQHTIYKLNKSVGYKSIQCIRHIKVCSSEDSKSVQLLELNKFTLEVCSVINKVIDIAFKIDKKNNNVDLEEYRKLRNVDKLFSKHSTFNVR